MFRHLPALIVAGIAIASSAQARAGGVDFGYTYTAEIEEPGETEVELWATDRRDKGEGHYDAQDYRLELERGITERFQIAAYTNFAGHHVRGLDGELDRIDRDFGFQGLAAEFKYQVLNPKKGGLGLAFYVEPAWSRISKMKGEKAREFELEFKAIVQKNFLDDRLVWAANLTVEPEWEREREELAPGILDTHTEKELAFEVTSGLAYKVSPHWALGVEGRYHSVYPDWTDGLHRENYAVYAGPTVHFSSGEWGVTATWLPQLFGAPSGPGSSLEYDDHEKRELRLKISREF
jgi:opacity protein-like surface antigen